MTSMTFNPVLLSPPPGCSYPPKASLDAEQEAAVQDVTRHFNVEAFELPARSDKESGKDAEERLALTEQEMMLLSRETFIRFLTATKWDVSAAKERLERFVIWRRTSRMDDVEWMAQDCSEEAWSVSGKNFILGFTPQAQPILYFFPSRNSTPIEKRRAIFAMFMIERAMDLMSDGVTNVVVLFNFVGKRQGPPTSISVAREALYALSNYYPETLGCSIFLNMPWVVKMFVNLMWPFVDPVTKRKVHFASSVEQFAADEKIVPRKHLLAEAGGDLDIPYDHEAYWPLLIKACLARRAENLERWRSLGPPQAGRSERDFKVRRSEPAAAPAP